jgi:hypothetical protein
MRENAMDSGDEGVDFQPKYEGKPAQNSLDGHSYGLHQENSRLRFAVSTFP